MSRYVFAPEALRDLVEIQVYIARDDREAAERLTDILQEKCKLLAEMPRIGRRRPEMGNSTRCFPVGEYIIFYCAVKTGIEIRAIWHGRRSLENLGRRLVKGKKRNDEA